MITAKKENQSLTFGIQIDILAKNFLGTYAGQCGRFVI